MRHGIALFKSADELAQLKRLSQQEKPRFLLFPIQILHLFKECDLTHNLKSGGKKKKKKMFGRSTKKDKKS